MLLLSRNIGESIIINEDIAVRVVGVNRKTGQVRLGFDAPKSVSVNREEIHNKILAEREDNMGHPVRGCNEKSHHQSK